MRRLWLSVALLAGCSPSIAELEGRVRGLETVYAEQLSEQLQYLQHNMPDEAEILRVQIDETAKKLREAKEAYHLAVQQ